MASKYLADPRTLITVIGFIFNPMFIDIIASLRTDILIPMLNFADPTSKKSISDIHLLVFIKRLITNMLMSAIIYYMASYIFKKFK